MRVKQAQRDAKCTLSHASTLSRVCYLSRTHTSYHTRTLAPAQTQRIDTYRGELRRIHSHRVSNHAGARSRYNSPSNFRPSLCLAHFLSALPIASCRATARHKKLARCKLSTAAIRGNWLHDTMYWQGFSQRCRSYRDQRMLAPAGVQSQGLKHMAVRRLTIMFPLETQRFSHLCTPSNRHMWLNLAIQACERLPAILIHRAFDLLPCNYRFSIFLSSVAQYEMKTNLITISH